MPAQSATSLDLRANYFGQRSWFFGLLLFLLVVSLVKDIVVVGSLPGGLNLGFHVALVALSLVALATRRDSVHHTIAVLAGTLMLAYASLLFRELQ